MKKLSLKKLNLEISEKLLTNQLKTVFGGGYGDCQGQYYVTCMDNAHFKVDDCNDSTQQSACHNHGGPKQYLSCACVS